MQLPGLGLTSPVIVRHRHLGRGEAVGILRVAVDGDGAWNAVRSRYSAPASSISLLSGLLLAIEILNIDFQETKLHKTRFEGTKAHALVSPNMCREDSVGTRQGVHYLTILHS